MEDTSLKVKIVDSNFYPFGGRSISLAGDNAGMSPKSFTWDGSEGYADIKFFTDIRLGEAKADLAKKKIALIGEPRSVFNSACDTVDPSDFFAVLTHDAELLQRGRPFAFFPFGGSWINPLRWQASPKEKFISMIVGHKRSASGHKLRHEIAEGIGNVDMWGEPYTEYIQSKMTMLKPYMYSIVVENDKRDYWFTEKLIDCLALGTIPIYWGCPSISMFFNDRGILSFDTLDELRDILSRINPDDYYSRKDSILENLHLARDYFCAEDWIYKRYPALFRL